MQQPLDIVILGLSLTSSWGNGHATTYRGLVRSLDERGHRVTFLERDVPWYAANRDLPEPPYGQTRLYADLEELRELHRDRVRDADLVIVGSYVPEGRQVARWAQNTARGLTAFYDIDTPVTLAALDRGQCDYLTPDLIPGFDMYLSFTGGPLLRKLERKYGAALALPLYCSVDPQRYHPQDGPREFAIGYLGTYSDDRQPTLERLLIDPATRTPERRYLVAGPQYPADIRWPENVGRVEHLPPDEHRGFYNRLQLTLNVTRADMIATGYAPSVRLFEAAACGTPIVSDRWEGIEEFLEPEREIFLVDNGDEVLRLLDQDEDRLREVGRRARQRILDHHTCRHRAAELEQYVQRMRETTASAR